MKERIQTELKALPKGRHAGSKLLSKSVIMLSLFILPIVLIYVLPVSNIYQFLILYCLSGLGMIGMGMGVMHDAVHGSYWKNKTLNKYFGGVIKLIGASPLAWKVQHNTLHHTFTNVEGFDEDIELPYVMRFSPHGEKRWFHRFQAFYFWFFYGLATIWWVTMKDYFNLPKYRKMGYIKTKKELRNEIVGISIWKVIYFAYILVIPMIIYSSMWHYVLISFLVMHFVNGCLLSLIFQVAHVMPNNEFPMPEKNGDLESNWLVHQIKTTTNFAPKSKLFAWFIGGLNFQVEHHLFPNISHIHYPKISKKVKETVEEFGYQYQVRKNFFMAVVDHIRVLNRLGKGRALS